MAAVLRRAGRFALQGTLCALDHIARMSRRAVCAPLRIAFGGAGREDELTPLVKVVEHGAAGVANLYFVRYDQTPVVRGTAALGLRIYSVALLENEVVSATCRDFALAVSPRRRELEACHRVFGAAHPPLLVAVPVLLLLGHGRIVGNTEVPGGAASLRHMCFVALAPLLCVRVPQIEQFFQILQPMRRRLSL